MKTKLVLVLALLAFTLSAIAAKEITSTEEGGLWRDKETWESGSVPFEDDNVTIVGKVTVAENSFCDTLIVKIGGTLVINDDVTLKTSFLSLEKEDVGEGDIENNGTIEVGDYKKERKDER